MSPLTIPSISVRTISFGLVIALGIAGCGQQSNAQADAPAASTTSAAKPALTASDSASERFSAISPDTTALKAFKYKVFDFSPDDSWVSIVPMPPKAGDVVVGINFAGTYEVKLTNEKCASAVDVSTQDGSSFELNSTTPKHSLDVDKKLQLKINMSDSAQNNYFCNIAVALASK